MAKLKEALKAEATEGPSEKESALLTEALGWMCRAQIRAGEIRVGAVTCEELLKRQPENVDGLVGRGEEALRKEDFDAGVRALNDAYDKAGRQDRDVLERLQKAQKLLKRSKVKVHSISSSVVAGR